jgi:hypothetical protein
MVAISFELPYRIKDDFEAEVLGQRLEEIYLDHILTALQKFGKDAKRVRKGKHINQ